MAPTIEVLTGVSRQVFAEEHLAAHGRQHFLHAGVFEAFVLGNHRRDHLAVELRAEQFPHVVGLAGGHLVGNGGQHLHLLRLEVVEGGDGGVEDLRGGFALPRNDDEHGGAQVLGKRHVGVEFKGHAAAQEVAAFHDHEVVVLLQDLVLADDGVDEFVGIARLGQAHGFFAGKGKGVFVADGQAEVPDEGFDVGVFLLLRRVVDDGLEVADALGFAQQHVHEAQRHHGLAAVGLGGGDKDGFGHTVVAIDR
jgi:hypothetical protein